MNKTINAGALAIAVSALAGCTTVPLTESGAISSYYQLGPETGTFSKSRSFLNRDSVLAAKTVSIARTRLSAKAISAIADKEDGRLVANAVDRALCFALSDRFTVVQHGRNADLVVRATVSELVPTGAVAAGISKVATLGTSAVLPVGIPRLPIGLGGLAVEGEATDLLGRQQAAITWSRGANSFTNGARVSKIGDAYSLASDFGNRFGRMLVKGEKDPSLGFPSVQRIGSAMGARPKNAICDTYGRQPGVAGFVGAFVGAPPSWADAGAPL